MKISITPDEAKATELKTRMQANSRLWFQMRAGRITASKFSHTAHTNPASTSISLIMSISHPDLFRFSTKATRWDCKHEKSAMAKYKETLTQLHDNLEVKECGLFISVENPFIGASPDGVIECKCCGWGVIEIKVSILSRHCIVVIHLIMLTLYSVRTVTEMRRLTG